MPPGPTGTLEGFLPGGVDLRYARTQIDLPREGILWASLSASGQQEPGVVSALGNVIAGCTRCKLLHAAGLPFLAYVRADIDTPLKEALFLAASDAKADRGVVDQARTLKAVVDAEGGSQKKAAQARGMSEAAVSVLLSIFKHTAAVTDCLAAGTLSLTHLAAVARFDTERQDELLLDAAARGLSARQLKREANPKPPKKAAAKFTVVAAGGVKAVIDSKATFDQFKAGWLAILAQVTERHSGLKKGALPVGVTQ